MASRDQQVSDVGPQDLATCLSWLLQKVRSERAQWIVAQIAERVQRKQLNDIFASALKDGSTSSGKNIAGGVAVTQPPNAATLLVLQSTDGEPYEGMDAIKTTFRHLVNRLALADVQFLQASCDDDVDRHQLRELGFEHLADLAFLVLESQMFAAPPDSPAYTDCHFEVVGASAEKMAVVCELAEQSFSATQDCPRLSDYRSAAQIVEGYRLAANFAPSLWRILLCNHQPAGCLILSQHKSAEAVEITYMGLLPGFRGKQLGKLILSEAIRIAAQLNMSRMVLAVDRENYPAIKLYLNRGWIEVAQESVWGFKISPQITG